MLGQQEKCVMQKNQICILYFADTSTNVKYLIFSIQSLNNKYAKLEQYVCTKYFAYVPLKI